ncbi:hypothetical protein P692DRAFT_20878574 [Suillus brevipes Sb2]|nr:hypothetical protein P692DRAFT_20878574 [Suillus brevipes Sb2]
MSGIATSSGASPDDDIGLSGSSYDMDLFNTIDKQEISHEGGEFSDAVKCTLEFAAQSKRGSGRYGKGAQARRQRLKMMYAHWESQMDRLVHAYLEWKHGSQDSATMEEDRHEFHVSVIGTFERNTCVTIYQGVEEPANVSLLRRGLIGCSPVEPTVAIELCTLELYHRLRRRHPQLSVQAMARALCDMHDVNYRPCYRDQFSIAFDAYLSILRCVLSKVNQALGRGAEDWRAQNMCPCCTYETLNPKMLVSHDGNNSSKRIAGAGSAEESRFCSTYFISREQVDLFKDEVQHRRTNHDMDQPREDDKDNVETDENLASCLRWKSSGPDHKKTALDIYETTGIFASACRHGFIIKVCEMVKSGELAKYPLAITDALIDLYGQDIGVGYDVGCTFSKIVQDSPLLGTKSHDARIKFCVNTFHGGFGLEDLETMEHVFSASNAVARTMRYATQYHWTQALDLHFQQWDNDKNNYVQAQGLIDEYTDAVASLSSSLGLTETDFERWIDEERQFLMDLKEEPSDRVLACSYVQALVDVDNAHEKWDSDEINYAEDARETSRLEAKRRAALDGLMVCMRTVEDLEQALSIRERWTQDSPEYQSALEHMQTHDFRHALDKLQQLVVQRLLELGKANMAGTGYKLHVHIGKAIKARSKAITSALNEYNNLAPVMTPPAPCLQWNDIDVLCKPWTVPGNREVAAKYFKLKRAYEELQRLDVKICRLRTFIHAEDTFLAAHVERLSPVDSMLAREVEEHRMQRLRINSVHIVRLDAIEALPGFSGSHGCGTSPALAPADADAADEDGEWDDIAADDAWNEDMTHLVDVLEGMALD